MKTDTCPPAYTIHVEDGTIREVNFEDLGQPGTSADVDTPPLDDLFRSLSHFLDRNAKLTTDHRWSFHNGCLRYVPQGGFCCEICRNPHSRKVEFSVPLPDFARSWANMDGNNVLVPGQGTVSTCLRASTSAK